MIPGTTIRKSLIAGFISLFVLTGCATDEYGNKRPMTNAEKGVLIGAATGVAIGMTTRDKGKNAVLVGIVGGIAGGSVGAYMDSQRKDFEKQLKPAIDQGAIDVEKLPDNVLKVTMTGQTTFEVDSSTIKPGFYGTMDTISEIVNKYGKTHLSIVGHTDSTGSTSYNQQLSLRRAGAVEQYLLDKGVIPQRLSNYGMGEEQPRASNATEAGRRLNRRVEIIIEPVVVPEQ
ncbi:MAG: OmpA family protein, partial [Pseudohongiellaceae bacterium]